MKKSMKIFLGVIIIIAIWSIGAKTYEKLTGKKIDNTNTASFTEDKKEIVEEKTKKVEIPKKELNVQEKEDMYINNIKTTSNILATEFKCIANAIQRLDSKSIKIHSENIVYNAKHLRGFKAPEKYKNVKAKTDAACNIYIDVYSKLYTKIDDSKWINEANNKINEANRLLVEASEKVQN